MADPQPQPQPRTAIVDPFDNARYLLEHTARAVGSALGLNTATAQPGPDPRQMLAGGAQRFPSQAPPTEPDPRIANAIDPVWSQQLEHMLPPPEGRSRPTVPVMDVGGVAAPTPGVDQPPAWPAGAPKGDGTSVSAGRPGTVPYDPNDPHADAFTGGQAGFLTTVKASMVPQTDPENVRKQIRIYSRDMGVPENRFFVDDEGDIRWADLEGRTHKVVPTIGGGSWDQPVDLLRRTGAQIGANVGPSLAPIVGGLVGMRAGPAAAAGTAAATEAQRQIFGNWLAGPENPVTNPDAKATDDLRWGNVGWHALGAGAGEVAAQTGGAIVGKMLETNPYNLSVDEIRLLRDRLGTARERARAANELGLHTTPYDLTDLPFLQRLETTVSKQPGVAGDIMKDYYRQRAEINFPAGVQTLFGRISSEGVPQVGLQRLQKGAERTVQHLHDTAVERGMAVGWRSAINSGARPDARPVVAQIRQILPHVNGETRAQLNKLLSELHEAAGPNAAPGAGSLVTDFEKLHNIRLDLDATLQKIRDRAPPAERGRLAYYLDPIAETYDRVLNAAHPDYRFGTQAYQQTSDAAADLRDGLLTLLSQHPTIDSKLTSTLFNADPQTVARARELFEQAGQLDQWNAGVRAFLEDTLNASHGPKVSGTFANRTAPYASQRGALDAALPPAEANTTRQVLDISQAQGRVPRPANRAEVEGQRLESDTEKLGGGGTLWKVIKAAAGPFKAVQDLGGRRIDRVFNRNAVDMAGNLTGQGGPPPTPGWRTLFGAAPPPAPRGPSTARVLENLEKSSRPFDGWKRDLLERMLYLNLQRAWNQAGGDPPPFDPTAPDLRLAPEVQQNRLNQLLQRPFP